MSDPAPHLVPGSLCVTDGGEIFASVQVPLIGESGFEVRRVPVSELSPDEVLAQLQELALEASIEGRIVHVIRRSITGWTLWTREQFADGGDFTTHHHAANLAAILDELEAAMTHRRHLTEDE